MMKKRAKSTEYERKKAVFTIKNYVKAESLEQAYELNQKRSCRILGGMLWMKMSSAAFQTAVDLSGVVSARIEEQEDRFVIGAMTCLRDLETSPCLNGYTNGAVRESLRHIVGVQFRNLATVGGSIFGRFGFSDVLTMFLAMDTEVELYKGGIVPLETFVNMPYDNDILVNIIVKKTPLKTVYLSSRKSKTDFPVLTCAVSVLDGRLLAVIGARPQKAVRIPAAEAVEALVKAGNPKEAAQAFSAQIAEMVETGSNMRGSAAYRRRLAGVLTRRACLAALEEGGERGC